MLFDHLFLQVVLLLSQIDAQPTGGGETSAAAWGQLFFIVLTVVIAIALLTLGFVALRRTRD